MALDLQIQLTVSYNQSNGSIEGLRGTAEYEIFKNRWGVDFCTVAIVASPDIRFARIQTRGRSEDGNHEQFLIRETRESGWGLNDLMLADYKLSNEETLQDFADSCESWLAIELTILLVIILPQSVAGYGIQDTEVL